jgi:receptor expression-enhancing protein 5/6
MTETNVQQAQQPQQNNYNAAAAASAIELLKKKAHIYLTSLDKELSKQPYCHDLERRTGVPKTYLVLGTAMSFFLLVFFNLGAKLLTNALSWIYPGK